MTDMNSTLREEKGPAGLTTEAAEPGPETGLTQALVPSSELST